ncbi:MAG: hypothetical protein H5T59_01175 [Anaerolineae bacterium]|nr:hypothetical protein [Anaerolineae bacterium]
MTVHILGPHHVGHHLVADAQAPQKLGIQTVQVPAGDNPFGLATDIHQDLGGAQAHDDALDNVAPLKRREAQVLVHHLGHEMEVFGRRPLPPSPSTDALRVHAALSSSADLPGGLLYYTSGGPEKQAPPDRFPGCPVFPAGVSAA